jgi:hypothetical protein
MKQQISLKLDNSLSQKVDVDNLIRQLSLLGEVTFNGETIIVQGQDIEQQVQTVYLNTLKEAT